MTRFFIALGMFLITLGAVYLWIWISTGTQPTFNIITFVIDTVKSVLCMVWYLIKFVFVMMVKVAMSLVGLGALSSVFSYPTYNC